MNIDFKILDESIDATLPSYGTIGSAGLDLRACLPDDEYLRHVILRPDDQYLFKTGIAIHIANPGYAGIIIPRSGLGVKHGIVLANLVGLIDSDYQGELMVCLWNRCKKDYIVSHLDKIAQLVIVPVVQGKLNLVKEFQQSERGEGGFGSTGKS